MHQAASDQRWRRTDDVTAHQSAEVSAKSAEIAEAATADGGGAAADGAAGGASLGAAPRGGRMRRRSVDVRELETYNKLFAKVISAIYLGDLSRRITGGARDV